MIMIQWILKILLIDLFQFGYIFTQEGLFTMDDGEYFLQPTRVNSQNVSDDIVGGPYMVRKMQPTQPDMEFGASGKKAIRTRSLREGIPIFTLIASEHKKSRPFTNPKLGADHSQNCLCQIRTYLM